MREASNGYDVIRRALGLASCPVPAHNLERMDPDFLNYVAAYFGKLYTTPDDMPTIEIRLDGTSPNDVSF